MPTDQLPTAEAAIQAGRQHYEAKRYKPALEQFTRAMKLCPCSRGMKRERCSCKNFEDVASKDESIFTEAMYNCKCSVGKTFNKCDKDIHIQALDYRAAAFEALKELERARRDAEWMLELAPRRLDGYLRLGKIARLQKKHEFSWKIYNAGIEMGTENGDKFAPKMQQLFEARRPLQRHFTKRDPMQLPLEIVLMVFTYVDFATLVRSLRVSRVWSRSLTSRGTISLWRTLHFTNRCKNPPTIRCLKKLLANSGNDAREIIIADAASFGLAQAKFMVLLNGSQKIERLELRAPRDSIYIPEPCVCKVLKHLILDGFDRRVFDHSGTKRAQFPLSLLKSSARTLRYLEVVQVPANLHVSVPQLHCLTSLKLEQRIVSSVTLPIFILAAKTPALERLWLRDVQLREDVPENFPWKTILKNLQTLIISFDWVVEIGNTAAIMQLLCVNSGRSLRHIDLAIPITDDGDQEHDGLIFTSENPLVPLAVDEEHRVNDYGNVRSLRLHKLIVTPQKLQAMFADNVVDGTLHTFDINFPLDDFGQPVGQASIAHLPKYEWLRGASSIRSLGVYDFRFREYPQNDTELPLPSFLASFPNLETLELRTGAYESRELCLVIKAILEVTHLKTIYQCQVQGVSLDELKVLVKSHGVELVWGERPREWATMLDG